MMAQRLYDQSIAPELFVQHLLQAEEAPRTLLVDV